MKLFVTIYEETPAAALDAIGTLHGDHDGIELRAERFGEFDFAEFRRATAKPLLLTYRGMRAPRESLERALAAGFDLVDVEYQPHLRAGELIPDRTVLSFHDYEGVPDVGLLVRHMRSFGSAHVKVAATPLTFADNERLLRAIAPGVSVIGMGERGLYSRILAPFRGSELTFVSTSHARSAAAGQLTLDAALEIFGSDRGALRAERVFAIAGNPAGHSRSPAIHNALFREKGLPAAYTIASIESFAEIENAFLNGEPCGLSVTAPFKRDALAFAERYGAAIGENARACGAVNTLVRTNPITADNTDVDGFETVLQEVCGRDRKTVALVGNGGTALAARIALDRAGMHVLDFSRAAGTLADLVSFDGEVIINTLPPNVEPLAPARAGMIWIEAAYGTETIAARHAKLRAAGVHVVDGIDLLRAQAVRQHELFLRAFE